MPSVGRTRSSSKKKPRRSASSSKRVASNTTPTKPPVEMEQSLLKWFMIIGVVGIVVAVAFVSLPVEDNGAVPCGCIIGVEHSTDKFARLLKSRSLISGVHINASEHPKAKFQALLGGKKCNAVVLHRDKPFTDIFDLRTFLKSSFNQKSSCVVWIVSLDSIVNSADPLKELFETNTLLSEVVVPKGKKGLFVLESDLTRDQLKEKLPHRVVHMLNAF